MQIDKNTIRNLMIDRDIGQKELSRQTGINRSVINGVVNGRSCTSTTAFKIATALDVPLESLVKRGGQKS